MNRQEILNELQHIVVCTEKLYPSTQAEVSHEAAERAKWLIREFSEFWPENLPEAPYVSPLCAACRKVPVVARTCDHVICDACAALQSALEATPPPAEPTPATERHIDTPDELLELLAGISSDAQIEGMSLTQKASTMALLHIAKALQQISGDEFGSVSFSILQHPPSVSFSIHRTAQSLGSPQEPS